MFYGPALWSILVNDPCVFEKNVYSDIWGDIIWGKIGWLLFEFLYIYWFFLFLFFERWLL